MESLLLEFYWMPLTSGLESWTGTWHLHCILCYSKAIDTDPIALFPGLLWLRFGSMQTGVAEDLGTRLTDLHITSSLVPRPPPNPVFDCITILYIISAHIPNMSENGSSSNILPVSSGVPQGSILEPLAFIDNIHTLINCLMAAWN